MIRGKFLNIKEDLKEVFHIRKKVFQEEQNIDEKMEQDKYDEMAMHALLYDENEKPVATGRIYFEKDYYKIGRVAVLKEERGKGYGDFIVKMLIDKAFRSGADEVEVDAQLQVVDFYKKVGFVPYGERFEKGNRMHQPMRLKRDDLCKKCNMKDQK